MHRYGNRSGASGIRSYTAGSDFIEVLFKTGKLYKYTYKTAGGVAVEKMKTLARAGRGLATYISREVRDGFETAE